MIVHVHTINQALAYIARETYAVGTMIERYICVFIASSKILKYSRSFVRLASSSGRGERKRAAP